MLSEEGVFSIIAAYLRLAGQGENVMGFRADGYYWLDIGKPESVLQATQDLKRSAIL
jgi:NDP-sugar pyrophosphorylase family protein